MDESHEATPAPADQEAVETNVAPQSEGTSETFTDSPPAQDDELYGRYEQMQADYTRKTQSLADQRREIETRREEAESWRRLQEDPDFQRHALEALGYEVPEDEPMYEPDEMYESDPRIDMVARDVAMLTEAEQERQAQRVASDIHDHIGNLSAHAGIELTPMQQTQLFRDAIDDGDPQPYRTEAIFNAYLDDLRAQQAQWEKQWLSSKRGVPHISQGGEQGSKRLDLSNKDERIKHMQAIMDANEA